MTEPDWTYVAPGGAVVTGDEARASVEKINDRRFLTRDAGIHTVSLDRWKLAQDAERHLWLDLRSQTKEGRQYDHAFMYDRYAMIADRTFANAIEIGCGPFPATAVLADRCTIGRMSLLDPLVEEYRRLPHCPYRGEALALPSGKDLPIAERIATPIEQFRPTGTYDLIVMLDVIGHCYNAPVVLRKVWDMLAPAGVLLFHDHVHDHAQVAAEAAKVVDVARPIKLDRKPLDAFLGRFERLFFRSLVTRGQRERMPSQAQVYLAGRKAEAA